MIGCLWFSHTTRLTPKSNGSYDRTFAFYQWMNKLDVSFHTVYKRHVSLRNMLVHSTDHTSIKQPGSRACQRPRCNTCCHISWVAVIRGPKSALYHLCRCPLLYIGETGRNLRSSFSEHLRSIRNNTPMFPMAHHFNSTGHSISDVQVRCVAFCNGNII